jgi:hypothetical protein
MPILQQRLALGIALVLVFLGTVGEISHGSYHQGRYQNNVSEPVVSSQSIAKHANCSLAAPVDSGNCPICDWENNLVSQPVAAHLPLLSLTSGCYTHFTAHPLFTVRQTIALRESRGPPRLA